MAKLASASREGKGQRSELNELRSTGKIPAIVYGYEVENTNVSVDENEFIKVIREVGRNGVIELDLNGKAVKVMVTDYQFDSLKNQITHIDFVAINMKSEVTVDVTVEMIGEAAGAKEGGVVEQPNFQVQVTATPDNIPESIEVNVEALEIGDTIHVSDIRESGNFTIENEDDEALVIVVPPQKEEEPDEDAEGGEVEGSEEEAASEADEEE
ncbi:50S ribosomal protein L25/general stress protein Ctc [Salinicoccus halodurans]|uniref:Large ribosomal subunit protein bL25 n=1 Tax=Salinicoccus halodurans TaxID=407035 RepID=A0A0F7HND4_9STAP|nr:50S ribosomal protein L25/general stress protein Ctc [Salinicoccus halodurans]AKG75143.1 50S ribosomal protein L25 [Salinicoccus halodurans]SFK66393.1 LSU ribosomal protein L25P [Salinicoccus halodurans]